MRLVAVSLFFLSGLVMLAGGYFNVWMQGMGCTFVTGVTDGGGCTFRMPWQMRGEDLVFLVLMPLGLVLFLALGGGVFWRWAARQR